MVSICIIDLPTTDHIYHVHPATLPRAHIPTAFRPLPRTRVPTTCSALLRNTRYLHKGSLPRAPLPATSPEVYVTAVTGNFITTPLTT